MLYLMARDWMALRTERATSHDCEGTEGFVHESVPSSFDFDESSRLSQSRQIFATLRYSCVFRLMLSLAEHEVVLIVSR